MTLSERRSKAVSDYFLAQGLSKEKIVIQFLGESKPLVNNDSKVDKQLNRRVEIIIEKGLVQSYKKIYKPEQIFSIPSDKDTTITCKEGTIIKVKANSFVSEKTGKDIKSTVNLSVSEYYKMSDILLANLSTTSNGDMLETAGMVYITASYNDGNCVLKKGETIEINFPSNEIANDMQLFTGSWENENQINWTPIQANVQQIVYTLVERRPIFRGYMDYILKYFNTNVKNKRGGKPKGKSGLVYITFTVDKKGAIQNARILRGFDAQYDSVALNAVRNMPSWTPGKHRGRYVNVEYLLPIRFNTSGSTWIYRKFKRENIEREYLFTNFTETISTPSAYYLFSSNSLGWINCDRFIKVNPKINYIVNLNKANENAIVNVVFDNYKSVMTAVPIYGRFSFDKVPSNEKITIVALKYIDNEPHLAIKNTKTSSRIEDDLVFKPVTMEVLKSELEKLNR